MSNSNISSPGIYINEIDQSFLAESIIQVGAAIVGPTAKGPVESPTVVTSYAEYTARFGELYDTGSNSYSFFNNAAAYNYFTNGGDAMLVTRVANGTYSEATADVTNSSAGGAAEVRVLNQFSEALLTSIDGTATYGADVQKVITGYVSESDGSQDISVTAEFGTDGSGNPDQLSITSHGTFFFDTGTKLVFPTASNALAASDSTDLTITLSGIHDAGSTVTNSDVGNDDIIKYTTVTGNYAFKLKTFAEGTDQNSATTGTKNNIKYEIKNANTESGTFTLEVRRGDDSNDNKVTLEQFYNCTLDPYDDNYIGKLVGTQYTTVEGSGAEAYVQINGEYPNKSKYVYAFDIQDTPNYTDVDGNINSTYATTYKATMPSNGTGTFTGATGEPLANALFGKDITSNNIEGVGKADFTQSLYLLQDPKYQYTALAVPGLNTTDHETELNVLLNGAKARQDYLAIVDLTPFNGTVAGAVQEAAQINNSFAASYYPWLLASEPGTGKAVWNPPSTFIPGVFAYNDKVGEPWFAPAGLNRGALPTVLNTARSLTKANRDTLYDGKVNPITAFPGAGIVVFGQKTLQSKASALDRINVRRLLITIKQFLDSQSGNIVFEPNTQATRNSFLSIVNPYLESVQQRQGLYAFKVIIDDSINTPAVIDRNQLVGQFYLQPTKTAEFVILNFNVQPTGASFPD